MRYFLPLAILTLFASPVSAQDMGWSTITPSIAGTDTLGLALRGDFGGDWAAPRGSPQRRTTSAPIAIANGAALDYQPSLERRRANINAFIADTRRRNAAAGADMQRVLGSRDVIAEFQPILDKYGLKTSNVGDALAVYWVVAWQTSRGNNDDFSRAKITAVRQQAVRALASLPAIRTAGDAAKQQFAESLLVHSLLLDAAVTNANKDPKILEMLAKVARSGAQGMGIDLTAMELTEGGFVAKGR